MVVNVQMYDPNSIYIPPGYGKITFGKVEIKHILLAVAALTVAFTIFFSLGYSIGGMSTTEQVLVFLPISFGAVITGFMLHEFAHKVVAQRNGAWAEFRAYPMGLAMSIVFALLGFILAAPGAVYIQGRISPKQNGLISIAGPLTNMGLAVLFFWLYFLVGEGLLAFALFQIGFINILLAAFNLLPIPPLDGYKVLKWSIPVYAAALLAAAVPAACIMFGIWQFTF